MYFNIMQKIKNLIKSTTKVETVDEQIIKVKIYGQNKKALKIIPYGIFYKLPDTSDIYCLTMQADGNEESLVTIATDIINRDDDLNDKELAIGIPTLKARMRYTDDDKIKFKIGDTLGGDNMVRFNELKTAFDQLKSDFDNHVHTNASTGFSLVDSLAGAVSGSTGSPTVASTADIDPAKIEEIEVPEL